MLADQVDQVVRPADGQADDVPGLIIEVLDAFGEEKVKAYIEEAASAANYKPEYENDKDIIIGYWMWLLLFTFVYALLAMITLEFIDKDKR